MRVTVACIQMNSGDDMQENLDAAASLVREAAEDGASWVGLPENCALMARDQAQLFAESPVEKQHPAIPFFRDLARECGVTLLTGSIAVRDEQSEKLRNRSYLFGPDGKITARYDKIHLFDASPSDSESHRESDRYLAGEAPVMAEMGWGRLGLTICYDLRFPYLYRKMALEGAVAFTVPAAFTHVTGLAHWEVLLRARAIENGAFVLAPAQCGFHPAGRRTHGHATIIGPWGKVLADAGAEKAGVAIADIELEEVAEVRRKIPSLLNGREISGILAGQGQLPET